VTFLVSVPLLDLISRFVLTLAFKIVLITEINLTFLETTARLISALWINIDLIAQQEETITILVRMEEGGREKKVTW